MSHFNTTQEEQVEDSLEQKLSFSIGSPLSSSAFSFRNSHNFSNQSSPPPLFTSSLPLPLPSPSPSTLIHSQISLRSEGRLVSLSKFLSSSSGETGDATMAKSQLSLVTEGFDSDSDNDTFISSPPPFSLPTSSVDGGGAGGGGSIAAFSTQNDEETISNKFTISPITIPSKHLFEMEREEIIIPSTYPDNFVTSEDIHSCLSDDHLNDTKHAERSCDKTTNVSNETINNTNGILKEKDQENKILFKVDDIVWAPWRYGRWAPAKIIQKGRRGKMVINYLHHKERLSPKCYHFSTVNLCPINSKTIFEGDVVYLLKDRRKLKYEEVLFSRLTGNTTTIRSITEELPLEKIIIGRAEFVEFSKRAICHNDADGCCGSQKEKKEILSSQPMSRYLPSFDSAETVEEGEEGVVFTSMISKILSPHKRWKDLQSDGKRIIITSHQLDPSIDRSKIPLKYEFGAGDKTSDILESNNSAVCVVLYGKKVNKNFVSKSCKYFLSLVKGYSLYKCMLTSSVDILEPLSSYFCSNITDGGCLEVFLKKYLIISYISGNATNSSVYSKWISVLEEIYSTSLIDVENFSHNRGDKRKIFIFSIVQTSISRKIRMFTKRESIPIIGIDGLFQLVQEINK